MPTPMATTRQTAPMPMSSFRGELFSPAGASAAPSSTGWNDAAGVLLSVADVSMPGCEASPLSGMSAGGVAVDAVAAGNTASPAGNAVEACGCDAGPMAGAVLPAAAPMSPVNGGGVAALPKGGGTPAGGVAAGDGVPLNGGGVMLMAGILSLVNPGLVSGAVPGGAQLVTIQPSEPLM